MANVRCPMCSKFNPPDAEICTYCGARLKPLRTPSSSQPTGPAANSEGDEPDWLRDLRSGAPGGQPDKNSPQEDISKQTTGESDSDVPDWLNKIRDRARGEGGDTDEASDSASDWLKGLQSDVSSAPQTGGASSDMDWLNRLDEPDAKKQKPAADNLSGAEDLPSDWLHGLADDVTASQINDSGSNNLPAFDSNAPAASEISDDDWMSKLSSWASGDVQDERTPQQAPPANEPEPFGSGAVDFGWLNSLDQGTEETPEEEQESTSGTGLTGFLSSLEDLPGEPKPQEPAQPEQAFPTWEMPVTPSSDIPDWLSGKDEQPFSQPEAPQSGSADVPNWLQSLGEETTEQPSTQPESPQSDSTGLPNWLQGLGEEPVEQPPAPQSSTEQGIPDWLRGAEAEPAAPAAPQEPSTGLPSWLSGDSSFAEAAPTESEPERAQPTAFEPAAADSGLPTWLAGFSDEASAPEETEPEQELPMSQEFSQAADSSLPTWLSEEAETPSSSEPAASGETPNWLAAFADEPAEPTQPNKVAAQPPVQPAEAEQTPSFMGQEESVPDWLRDFESQPPAAAAAVSPLLASEETGLPVPALEGDQPFAVDLPDWLSEDAAASTTAASEQPAEMANEDLAHAELPEWVKDMRPIESIIPGEPQAAETEQRTEKAGPLAGMRGVLPVEETVSRYRKPPVYSVKLHVTEKQRSQAALLDSILAQETQPLLIPPAGKRAQGLLLRILVAILLIAALAFPQVIHLAPLANPVLVPQETQNMLNVINQASSTGAPVLLAVDYEPGLSGEMQLASAPVIEHLMAKNVKIVVVSSVPAGPALAEQLLSSAAAKHTNYNLAQNTINLGYLPGGTISLLEFVRQPSLAAPAALNGALAWQEPILSNISKIDDFAQVIVLTDTAETGRDWVEQVQPKLGATPLLMVSSAQATPLIQPYVESGQVDGMVSGLLGGVMYAQGAGQTDSPVSGYLASYQVGVLLALALVLIAGLVSGGTALLKRKNEDEE